MIDWDKIIRNVCEVARKTLTLAFAVILVMFSFSVVYIVAMALLWAVRYAKAVLGS